MIALLIIGTFIILLLLGTPIAFIIGIVSVIGILFLESGISLITVFEKMFSGLDSFVLLAVPLFILAANLMNGSKITEKLINFSTSLVGHVRGGLAHANVVVSMIFAGISGSATADTAGVGKILIPSMVKEGYSKETSVAVTGASSTIGSIIPPSIIMVIYGSITGTSIGALFLAGIIPGILVGISMMIIIYFVSKKENYPKYERVKVFDILKQSFSVALPLLTPIIIIVGIVGGVVTPTEAAVVACVYTFILGMFIEKTLKLKDLPNILWDTISLSCISLFALSTANALGQLMSYYNVSQFVSDFFNTAIESSWVFLLAVIILFLFLGTFMDAIPAMVIFVPVIFPASQILGVDGVHLGLIIVVSLAMGFVTPPYGLCLLIASSIAKLPINRAIKAVTPYLLGFLVVLIILAYLPQIYLWVPDVFM